MRVEKTLEPGKLVRDAPDELRRVFLSEAQPGEVIVSLLETATDEQLSSGGARLWVALTDRRALILASGGAGDSFVRVAETSSVSRRGRLGRDELTIGDRVLKCPLLRGGSEFKQFANLAEAHRIERLRSAAKERLNEDQNEIAAIIAQAGLNYEDDPTLHTIRVIGLVKADATNELGAAIVALVKADRDLSHWDWLYDSIRDDGKVLWMVYQAAQEVGIAQEIRSKLVELKQTTPSDALTAELAITMYADEGSLADGFDRAIAWRTENTISAKTFLSACTTLSRAGFDTEPLHRFRSITLAELGNLNDALTAIRRALELESTPESLRVLADLTIRAGSAQDAIEPLEKLLEIGHDDAWIRSMLADGYEAQNRFDDALSTREIALERLLDGDPEAEQVAAERRALARLHRNIASSYPTDEHDVRLACADLLDRGLDWAARIIDMPTRVFAGTELTVNLEVLAARPLTDGNVKACLTYEEEIIDQKADQPTVRQPPSLLVGGLTGVWSPHDLDESVVHADKKTARARYGVGDQTTVHLGRGIGRGLHRAKIDLAIPSDVRPSYHSEKVRGQLELEITPPRVRFPMTVAPCHAPETIASALPEERDGTGRHDLQALLSTSLWSFGEPQMVEVKALLKGDRLPTRLDATIVAVERMRPPHKGVRVIESLSWSYPLFPYELREGVIDRRLYLDMPREGLTTGIWTWFELVWRVEVKLMRKEKVDATVEIPILLKFPPSDPVTRDPREGTPSSTSASQDDDVGTEADSRLQSRLISSHDPNETLPGSVIPITDRKDEL